MSISSSRLVSPAAIARRDAHSSGPIAFPEPCQKPSLLAYRSCPGTIRRPQIRLEAGLCSTTSPARSTTATPTGRVSSTCRSCDSASLSLLMSIIAPTARRARPWASRSMTLLDARAVFWMDPLAPPPEVARNFIAPVPEDRLQVFVPAQRVIVEIPLPDGLEGDTGQPVPRLAQIGGRSEGRFHH